MLGLYTSYKIQTLSLTHEHLEGARFGHDPTIKTTIQTLKMLGMTPNI
jgi:hypothetical protein